MSKWMRLLAGLTIVASLGIGGASGNCNDPTELTLVSAAVAGDTISTTIENPTSMTLSGYVYGTVQFGGRRFQFEGLVNVDGLSTATFHIRFPGPINVLEAIGTCGGHGVSDTSDPIVSVVPIEE